MHEKDVYISYLPLAHIFDRIIEEGIIWSGAALGFWRGVSINIYVINLSLLNEGLM